MQESTPIGRIDSLAASGERIVGDVTLYRLETFAVTARVTYNASATSGIRVKLYYSPDGDNYDSVAYAYFDVDLTADSTIQETKLVDAPENGHIRVSVENLDGSYAATNISVWASITKE